MKKIFPLIILAIVAVGFGILLVSNFKQKKRKIDERISLRQKDKIPYGMEASKRLLPRLFPGTTVYYDTDSPGDWEKISVTEPGQAVVLVATYFDPLESELNELARFVQKGNYVFIIARQYSYAASEFFGVKTTDMLFDDFENNLPDSLRVRLEKQFFSDDTLYVYPGKRYDRSFSEIDTGRTLVLGRNHAGAPNFLQMKTGEGSFFLHSAPLAFSNYFILHKNNIRYYESAFSVIPQSVSIIAWNEYYQVPQARNEEPNWLSIMLQHEEFKWGFFTAIAALALFMLLGMRRKQRMIPVHGKPKNDSLDYVKTLGRLYYDRKDHKNLAMKMGVYFLEHIRTKYKLPTNTLDDKFVQALHFKTAYPEQELSDIVSFIQTLDSERYVSEERLSKFHKQLELYYQNT